MFDGKYFDWNQKRIKGIVDHYGYKFFYGKKILDLGCGYGDLSGVLYRFGAEITAVDARQEHLKIVSKKFPGVKVMRANLDGTWPFFGQKFDFVLDLGLLCHLSNYENHLRDVCSATNYLILETAVCDSDDPSKCIKVPENKETYDLAYSGAGCRPSALAIEKVLADCGMTFKRLDNSKFNSGDYIYDWQAKNDNSATLGKRRIWFACKNTEGVVTQNVGSQPIVVIQPPTGPNFDISPKSKFPITHHNSHHMVTASPRTPVSSRPSIDFSSTDINNVTENSKKFAIVPGQGVPQFPQIKVLYLPLGRQPGMEDAFRNVGVQLEVFDFWGLWERTHSKGTVAHEFLNMVKRHQPDLIHMQLQFTGLLDANIIQEARKLSPGVVITNWSGDVRDTAIPNFTSVASVLDCSLISSTGQLSMYKAAGCSNVKYWQIGYNPKVNFPENRTEFKYDVSFLANNYGNTFPDGKLRTSVIEILRNMFGVRFGLFGAGYVPQAPSVEPTRSNSVYNDSICTLSISNYNNISHYFSDRLLHCLGAGRPTITWYFPRVEDYFKDGEDIFIARSAKDIVNIVNKCKGDPEMANKVGLNGYNKVLQEHTFTSRILELLDMTGLIHLV